MASPKFSIFKKNPVVDPITAVLTGNQAAIWRIRKNPRSGWTSLKLAVFPKSAAEANYPQRVKKNGQ